MEVKSESRSRNIRTHRRALGGSVSQGKKAGRQPHLWFCIRQEFWRSRAEARRAGLDACKNELVALMDADDISVETRFEQQLRMFKNSNADIIGGDIMEFID